MADINLTQVIHNVKEAYVDLTGDTDDITYGNISTKISEIQTGGGITGGYTVTFKVDGNDYYIASCQQGESITEPPTPTLQTGTFAAWQLNDVDVSFPYTPSADVELTAYFSTVRTEMEIYDAGTVLLHNTNYNSDWTKTNATTKPNFAIAGYYIDSITYTDMVLIGKVSDDVATSYYASIQINTITYNGETYYYSRVKLKTSQMTNRNDKAFYASSVTGTENWADLVSATLDHYFYKD